MILSNTFSNLQYKLNLYYILCENFTCSKYCICETQYFRTIDSFDIFYAEWSIDSHIFIKIIKLRKEGNLSFFSTIGISPVLQLFLLLFLHPVVTSKYLSVMENTYLPNFTLECNYDVKNLFVSTETRARNNPKRRYEFYNNFIQY